MVSVCVKVWALPNPASKSVSKPVKSVNLFTPGLLLLFILILSRDAVRVTRDRENFWLTLFVVIPNTAIRVPCCSMSSLSEASSAVSDFRYFLPTASRLNREKRIVAGTIPIERSMMIIWISVEC